MLVPFDGGVFGGIEFGGGDGFSWKPSSTYK